MQVTQSPEETRAFLAKHGLTLSAVTKVESVGDKDVYDITVPGVGTDLPESFIANGVVTHNSASADYLENIIRNMGVKADAKSIFGIRDEKSGKWLVPPRVRYKSEAVAEKFFDYVAKLQRMLPDKKKIGDNWYYIYEDTKENRKIVGTNYDVNYWRKTKNLRVPAPDGTLQALILLDSYPAMLPEKQDVDDPNNAIASQARMFSDQLKRVKGKMRGKRIAVLGINQLRLKPMVMYGCFHYQQRVRLADGGWDYIGRIVSQKRKVKVLSYNTVTGKFEPKKVVGWYNNGNAEQGDFLKIRVQAGLKSGYNDIVCTKNHLLFDYTTKAMRPAIEFLEGDCLTTDTEVSKLSSDLTQLVYGSFLGDGSFNNKRSVPSMFVCHAFSQEDYLHWKYDLLSELNPSLENCKAYASLKVDLPVPSIKDMIEEYKSSRYGRVYNGVPEEIFSKLELPGLAIWYADDGTFYDAASSGKSTYWQLGISAKRLSESQLVRLNARIVELTGVSLHVGSRGLSLTSKEEIRKFHEALAPYLPESMSYKLYDNCTGIGTHKWKTKVTSKVQPYPASIISISEYQIPVGVSKGKFDLEVEGNHTYMVGNCVVHNSPEYEPCGEALKLFSDVRMKWSSRALSAVGKDIGETVKGNGQIEEEPCIFKKHGVDNYRYIHVRGHKNKLSRPYLESWLRLWITNSDGEAQGFDPVFDTYMYLRSTGQVSGKRNKMLIKIKGNEATKSIGWLDFKSMILGDRNTVKEMCQTAGMKPFDIRKKCFSQLAAGTGLDMFNQTEIDNRGAKAGKRAEDEDSTNDGDDDNE